MSNSENTHALRLLGSYAISFLGISMVAVTGGVLALLLFTYYLGYRSEAWPSTQGVVVDTEIKRVGGLHSAEVNFEYTVDGETYQRNTQGYGLSVDFRSNDEAIRFLSAYPEQASVRVYYDPSHPGFSTLKPGLHLEQRGLWLLAVMAVLLLIGIWLSVVGLRKSFGNYRTALNDGRQRRRSPAPTLRRSRAVACMVVATILAVGAGFGFFGGKYAELRATQAANWPSTQGRITSAEVRYVRPRRTVGQHVAFIEYAFSVGGQNFVGDSQRILPAIQSSHETAEQTAARLRSGTVVDVYYDPNNPLDAVLDKTVDDFGTRIINQYAYWCLISLAGASVLFLFGVRNYRRAGQVAGTVSAVKSDAVPSTYGDADLDVAMQDALRRYANM